MEWTRLFDEKLRLINKQLYTIVEVSRIIAHHLTFSLSFSFILFLSLSRFFPCSRSRNGEAAWLQINLTLYKYVQCNVRHRRASLLHMYIYSTNSKRNLGRLLARSFARNSGGRGGIPCESCSSFVKHDARSPPISLPYPSSRKFQLAFFSLKKIVRSSFFSLSYSSNFFLKSKETEGREKLFG